MKSLAPNTLLQNRYLVVHLIGKGGMGDVYLAVDQRLGSAVALKRTFFSDDEMLGSAFEREAKTLARLRHPVLTKVSDHFIENGEQYLVMEHISGDDLSKRLEAAQKPFPLSWVLFWADQLLDSLAYLHAHEPPIIHRDIKPQNLKLTDENSIILLDFGLSKNNTGESRVMSGSTGSIVGYTPHYAPMEQIRGTGTNPRSDIYSLSATLYQLMTNLVPSDSLTRADALLNDMSDPIKPINEINPEVSSAVSQVILKGMEISQERRFPNAREMQKTLRDAFANMQNAMTADTVAFNVQKEQVLPAQSAPVSQPISQSQEETEVLNIPLSDIPPLPVVTKEIRQNGDSLQTPTNGIKPSLNDATMRMDSSLDDSGLKQSDVKTEVFIAGSSPEIAAVQNQSAFAQNKSTPSGNLSNGENVNKADSGGFTPEATVPLFNYENQEKSVESDINPGDSMFFTNPNIGQKADSFATYTPATAYSDNPAQTDNFEQVKQFNSQPQPLPPVQAVVPVKKKSGGKGLAILGGLGALLLLAIAGVGGGWYYYNNFYNAGITENPTPMTSPSVEFSPFPESSLPVVLDTNVNSSNANTAENTNVSNSNLITDTNTAKNTGSTTISTPTPVVGSPTLPKTPTPRPVSPKVPTPTKQVLPPTPTPKKIKGTPPIIEQ
jgi:serine/threonine protein kinase